MVSCCLTISSSDYGIGSLDYQFIRLWNKVMGQSHPTMVSSPQTKVSCILTVRPADYGIMFLDYQFNRLSCPWIRSSDCYVLGLSVHQIMLSRICYHILWLQSHQTMLSG